MIEFDAAVESRVLVCDGGMGTMLQAAGVPADQPPAELNLGAPELVTALHQAYVDAGADIIQTNTFGANAFRLADSDPEHVRSVNRAGARLARSVADAAGRGIFVAGSISPVVPLRYRGIARDDAVVDGVGFDERWELAISQQIEALVVGGVDLLVLETFGYLTELVSAVRVTRRLCDLPIIAQLTFSDREATLGGEAVSEAMHGLRELAPTVVGSNCTLGPQAALSVVRNMREHTTLPLAVQPNAGLPYVGRDRTLRYAHDSAYFGRYVRRYLDEGVRIVGGCCGTTPDHIRAAAAAVAAARRSELTVAAYRRESSLGEFVSHSVDQESGTWSAKQRLGAELRVAPRSAIGTVVAHATALVEAGAQLVVVGGADARHGHGAPVLLGSQLGQRLPTEVAVTITTWHRSIMTLQADLLGTHASGVRTILCETGNPPVDGDYPDPYGAQEVDALGLIRLLDGLNHGVDSNGIELQQATSFRIGARCNPGAGDLDAEIARTRQKVDAGAHFLLTRAIYEPAALRTMLTELADLRVPVFVTIDPLPSYAEAEYLRGEVPDIVIPDETMERLRTAHPDDGPRIGMELAEDLAGELQQLVHGIVVVARNGDPEALLRLRTVLIDAPR